MPVYEGILEKVSSGEVISTAPSRVLVTQGAFGNFRARGTGYQRQAGYTRREFIQVGEQRITYVMLMSYHDALLQEAVGKHVALSIDKTGPRNTVIAMRTPDAGLVKPEMGKLIRTAIRLVLVTWIVAAIFGTILTLILAAFLGTTGAVIGVLATLAFALRPLYHIWKTFRARSALDSVPLAGEAVGAG
jgi:hypothetical protein